MKFFNVKLVTVGYGDNSDFVNAVFFVKGKFLLRFDPKTLFSFKGGGDDQFIFSGEVTVYAKGTEVNPVFDKRQCDHAVKLVSERLVGSEVFDKSEIVQDHLLAAPFDSIVNEIDQPLLLKTLHGAVDKIFGNFEILFGKTVDLVDGHGLGVVAGEDENEGLLIWTELLLEKLFHKQSTVFGMLRHGRQRTRFEEVVECNSCRTSMLKSEKFFIIEREKLYGRKPWQIDRCTA